MRGSTPLHTASARPLPSPASGRNNNSQATGDLSWSTAPDAALVEHRMRCIVRLSKRRLAQRYFLLWFLLLARRTALRRLERDVLRPHLRSLAARYFNRWRFPAERMCNAATLAAANTLAAGRSFFRRWSSWALQHRADAAAALSHRDAQLCRSTLMHWRRRRRLREGLRQTAALEQHHLRALFSRYFGLWARLVIERKLTLPLLQRVRAQAAALALRRWRRWAERRAATRLCEASTRDTTLRRGFALWLRWTRRRVCADTLQDLNRRRALLFLFGEWSLSCQLKMLQYDRLATSENLPILLY